MNLSELSWCLQFAAQHKLYDCTPFVGPGFVKPRAHPGPTHYSAVACGLGVFKTLPNLKIVSSCQLSTLSWSLWCSASSQFIWLHLVARCSTQFRPASPCFNWMHTTAPRLSEVWKNEFRNLAEPGWHGCYMLLYLDTSRLWPAYFPGGCNRAITLAH